VNEHGIQEKGRIKKGGTKGVFRRSIELEDSSRDWGSLGKNRQASVGGLEPKEREEEESSEECSRKSARDNAPKKILLKDLKRRKEDPRRIKRSLQVRGRWRKR